MTFKLLGRSTAGKFNTYKIFFIKFSVSIVWATTFSFADVQSHKENLFIKQITNRSFLSCVNVCKIKIFLFSSLLNIIIESVGPWVGGLVVDGWWI